jgi:hypothetical protein
MRCRYPPAAASVAGLKGLIATGTISILKAFELQNANVEFQPQKQPRC